MQKYLLDNLDCANCAARIEDAVKKTEGVHYASVNFSTSTLYLDADDFSHVAVAINRIEPDIIIREKSQVMEQATPFNLKRNLGPILVSGVIFIAGIYAFDWLERLPYQIGLFVVFGTAYLVSGWKVLASAFKNVIRGKIFDENFLMSVATLGAVIIGEIPEAVGVMLFYQVGEFVQELAVSRTRRSIQGLLENKPDIARLVIESGYLEVDPETVQVGEKILVKPGDRVPLDGRILSGNSQIDTSPLTGEFKPMTTRPGDEILGGSINLEGVLTLEVIRPYGESSISRILELVEQASSRKAVTEKFITKFARVYSPIVVFSAILVALVPPLLTGDSFSEWIYRALVVLVISCPCALVISIPIGYFGGIGGASRQGILVKGSNFLDILAAVKTVVFDKTGTLTRGVFKVTRVTPQNGYSQDDVLRFAALAEAGSNHPIAKSIRDAVGQIQIAENADYQEIAGHGVQTTVDGRVLIAGNDPLLHKEKIHHNSELCDGNGTVVHVAFDGKYAGCLEISDELKSDAQAAIQVLRSSGVENIFMLTGDNQEAGKDISDRLGLDGYKAGLLPEDKVAALEEILEGNSHLGKVAFVGDGVNDAPALARSDVGIAMGSLGTEAAIETADVVIMADSPTKVANAIRIGRKTRKIVWQNIVMAFVIKGVFIALGISGDATMWQAVFGDMGVALIAVFNATRALSGRN